MRQTHPDVTKILRELQDDPENAHEAAKRLFSSAYKELHRMAAHLMRNERPDNTLQATALVHEAYLRLVDRGSVDWRGRAYFFGAAARAMRQVLIDHARETAAAKRGGRLQRVTFDSQLLVAPFKRLDVLDFDRILTRFAALDERAARVVEYRVFAGMSIEEISYVLGVSVRTVESDWRMAKMWVKQQLAECT